jgi:hypothetical protein
MKQIDLPPDQWKSEGHTPIPPPKPPKYPRKTWFGLTDYGPPPLTWGLVFEMAILMTALVIGRLWFGP